MQSLNLNSILKKTNYHRPLLFNSVLWLLAFIILAFIFSKGKSIFTADLIFTGGFIIFLAIPACINFYVLIPRLLKREKYLLYAISFTINLAVFSLLCDIALEPILDQLFPGFFFISYLSGWNIFLVFAIFLIASTLIKLAEDWIYFNTNENRILKQRNQQIATQLSALRAQINPHFLFNALNVIYALALEKKEGISDAVLQLSDILRYVIYDTDTQRIALKDEIKLIKNYIAFQNHRINSPTPVNLKLDIENENFDIYPMLLLPLIENSYKHGIISGKEADPIQIALFQKNSNFKFVISNANLQTDNKIKDKYFGVGLENIKTNLDLVYPSTHELNITESMHQFKVELLIKNEH